MDKRKSNPPFLNGVPEMLLLKLLARRPMYGYELVQAIRAATDNSLEFGEGCIYPILHRLEAEKLLAARRETVAGRTRVVYQATPKGKAQLASSVSTWQRVAAAIARALEGGERERAAVA
jgi:PadR family transcriptional regulator PadR